MSNQTDVRRKVRRGTTKRRAQQRMQLQTFKAITLVTDVPTESNDVDFHLEPNIRDELEEEKIYTQARQGPSLHSSIHWFRNIVATLMLAII